MNAYHHLVAAALLRAGARAPTSPNRSRLRSIWQRWRERRGVDAMNLYLAQATDHADLEHRIRAWDEASRLDHMPLR